MVWTLSGLEERVGGWKGAREGVKGEEWEKRVGGWRGPLEELKGEVWDERLGWGKGGPRGGWDLRVRWCHVGR